jgi:hypothetical protein
MFSKLAVSRTNSAYRIDVGSKIFFFIFFIFFYFFLFFFLFFFFTVIHYQPSPYFIHCFLFINILYVSLFQCFSLEGGSIVICKYEYVQHQYVLTESSSSVLTLPIGFSPYYPFRSLDIEVRIIDRLDTS